jgi:hypothetical protein
LKTSCQRAIFLPEPLLIDQHREAFLDNRSLSALQLQLLLLC